MCGIVGIVGVEDVNQRIFDALTVLQHRGQDAAGMVVCEDGHLSLRKANGLVRDVFRVKDMLLLRGKLGIGHVRYPTAGSQSEAEAQPFYVNSPYGIALSHNGNLTNAHELKTSLFRDDLRHINTGSDSEVILNVLAHELHQIKNLTTSPEHFFTALSQVYQKIRGGYAVVALIANVGILAFRDPNGIRPLVLGRRMTAFGVEHMVASESVALSTLGFEYVRDIQPGEALFIDMKGQLFTRVCHPSPQLSPCLFEFVYFARPDSFIDGISVYKLRLNIGKKLAEKIQREWVDYDIDVVIPVPETARAAASTLASKLGIKCREGFVKNRYIGRTFIMPGQTSRKKSVRQKLNTIPLEFKGKHVLIVDDSIVRGTTSQEIIQMAREAGARKVSFAAAAPPIRYPNIYGIDMPSSHELIAYNRTVEEIRSLIQADALIFADLEDLISAAREGNPQIKRFEASVFDGYYVTGTELSYLQHVANGRESEDLFYRPSNSIQAIDLT